MRIPGPPVLPEPSGRHSKSQVNEEASRETKEGQLKGKDPWLERKDTGDLSSYTVTDYMSLSNHLLI